MKKFFTLSIFIITSCSNIGISAMATVGVDAFGVSDPIADVNRPTDIFDIIADYNSQKNYNGEPIWAKNDIDFLNKASQILDDIEFYFGQFIKVDSLDNILEDIDVIGTVRTDRLRCLKIYIGRVGNLLKYYDPANPALSYLGQKLLTAQHKLNWLSKLFTQERIFLYWEVAVARKIYESEFKQLEASKLQIDTTPDHLAQMQKRRNIIQSRLNDVSISKTQQYHNPKSVNQLLMDMDEILKLNELSV